MASLGFLFFQKDSSSWKCFCAYFSPPGALRKKQDRRNGKGGLQVRNETPKGAHRRIDVTQPAGQRFWASQKVIPAGSMV